LPPPIGICADFLAGMERPILRQNYSSIARSSLSTTGVHRVTVDFCDCRDDICHQRTQLLRARWFPATVNRPKTVFTFDVLETFHELSLQGKTTAYDFYYSIIRRTDNLQLGKATVGFIC
jgi:hypothetical protein